MFTLLQRERERETERVEKKGGRNWASVPRGQEFEEAERVKRNCSAGLWLPSFVGSFVGP